MRAVAFLRGDQGALPPVKLAPLTKLVARQQGDTIAVFTAVALCSWCQITPFTQSCIMSSGILGPQIQMWPPRTAAARNAPGCEIEGWLPWTTPPILVTSPPTLDLIVT